MHRSSSDAWYVNIIIIIITIILIIIIINAIIIISIIIIIITYVKLGALAISAPPSPP
jgi:uncharacterized metal-binding protein